MLEKPNIDDRDVVECLRVSCGLEIIELTFLPLGADINTIVYRAIAADATPYFVKLRRGEFSVASVAVPNFLYAAEVRQVIPAIPNLNGELCSVFGDYTVIVYPFVNGEDGFDRPVSDGRRVEWGMVLKTLHTTDFPDEIIADLRQEQFSSRWRDKVTAILEFAGTGKFEEPIAKQMLSFLREHHAETAELVRRAKKLAADLMTQSLPFVVCHADTHGWNMLIDEDDNFFVVDWDTLILAPKERDLMFVGCGLGGRGQTLEAESELFYQGYGAAEINQAAVAYYRYERIIEDIAVIFDEIVSMEFGDADRVQALGNLQSNFDAEGTIARAQAMDNCEW